MAQELRRTQTGLPESTSDFFRMSPFQLMRSFSEEMDHLWRRGGDDLSSWRPAVDVRERDGQLQVHVELPGVNEKDVKVALENDTLVIQGERRHEERRKEEGVYRSEISYGSFYRAIPLPEGAEADKANAKFNNGVLEISMPVAKSRQSVRQIPITSATTQQEKARTAG